MLVYNREDWNLLPKSDAGASDAANPQTRRGLLMKAKPLYVSRSIGELVEGRQ